MYMTFSHASKNYAIGKKHKGTRDKRIDYGSDHYP